VRVGWCDGCRPRSHPQRVVREMPGFAFRLRAGDLATRSSRRDAARAAREQPDINALVADERVRSADERKPVLNGS